MSDFFNSEIVKQIMNELADIQEKLMSEMFVVPFMSQEEKREHLDLMRTFLEKQKLLFFRMTLSDDKEAQETKERILESAELFGLREGQGINEFFEIMEQSIQKLEKSLDLE